MSIAWRALQFAALLLLLRVTASVLVSYRDYLPPNFSRGFLQDRGAYFWHGYHVPFYAHIASGPLTLILGVLLLSQRFRRAWPRAHRILGRIQVFLILCLLVPGGLIMAWYAAAGPLAAISLGLLACATAVCMVMGWQTAIQKRFAAHRLWMERCFTLLCSAVVLRVLGGFGTVLPHVPVWYDIATTWSSWLVPLAAYELIRRNRPSLSMLLAGGPVPTERPVSAGLRRPFLASPGGNAQDHASP